MKIKLSLLRSGSPAADLVVTVEPTASLGSVAEALAERDPLARGHAPGGAVALRLHAEDGSTSVPPPSTTVAQVSLRSGSRVSLAPVAAEPDGGRGAAVATLRVLHGPDAGREFPLPQGSSSIGRSRASDVRLSDPLVSKEHARLNVADTVELVDLNSANGLLVDDVRVDRVLLGRDTTAVLGDSTVSVVLHHAAVGVAAGTPTLEFNRSPRLEPRLDGTTFGVPEAPTPPQPTKLPWLSLLAPLVMGAVLYAVTRSVLSLLFIGLSPVLALGTWAEGRFGGRRAHRAARARYREALAALRAEVDAAHDDERVARRAEHPAVDEVLTATLRQSTLLWSRRPDRPGFLQLRLGLGAQPSRQSLEDPNARGVEADLVAELAELRTHTARLTDAPVVADLVACGAVGVAGPGEPALAVARGLLLQLVGLHSPAELVLAGLASPTSAARWGWTTWLPHVGSAYSPLPGGHLESTPLGCVELVGALVDLVQARSADRDARPLPRVVVLVENDAPVTRARLVDLAERGPAVGVHLLWVAPSVEQLPAACRAFAVVAADGTARGGLVDTGEEISPLAVEPLSGEQAEIAARRLAPVADVGALVDDDSDLPTAVTTLALAGTALGSSAQSVVDRWVETESLLPAPGTPVTKRRTPVTLRALVGQAATAPLSLDLLGQGPHALVGGTTGAGKSEFLQTWVLAMAATYSPQRVTFLFVDYKGGAAFKDCVHLPHSVGMVTDLSPHLVRRALTSLNAELKHREELLHGLQAKDLAELEKQNSPECPPRLVIVVDEFAALVSEVPEFVDGVVNVAQRGRSLGLHLILATQRPAGVIKDNLRANTNLRVALRMADESDSTDVLGTPMAAAFDPELPGRAVAKTGPGRLTVFQSSYAGGHTPDEAPPPAVHVDELVFGAGQRWEEPDRPVQEGPSDMSRLVAAVGAANGALELPPPRLPWLPELSPHYDLAVLPNARVDHELVLGVQDDPERQQQPVLVFAPETDGNMVVFGTGGTGKSALLRTVAVSAAMTLRGGPTQVYALDFAGGALSMLEDLPHVGAVVLGDDGERVDRLLRMLRAVVEERAPRYAAVRAGGLRDYRQLAGAADEARIVLLVDGLAAFRTDYEFTKKSAVYDRFLAVAAEGRQVGVHVVVSADRPSTLSSNLGSSIQQRLVLRLADDNDYAMLGVPSDVLSAGAPPGRGLLGGRDVQIAVLGGQPGVAVQSAAVARLASTQRYVGKEQAPPVGRLPQRVALSSLPVEHDGWPVVGVSDTDLGPMVFEPWGATVVSGPGGSGRTTALATLALAVARWQPRVRLVYLGNARSALVQAVPWADCATDPTAIADLARAVTERVEDTGTSKHLVVVERITDLNSSAAESPVAAMIQALRQNGHGVVGDGEGAALAGFATAPQALRADRRGFALQPDGNDGASLFQAAFGSPVRAEFPPGRCLSVVRGVVTKGHLAVPE